MYKELKLILLTLISIMLLVGCQQTTKQEKIEIKSNDKTTISYEELSEKEQYMMTVTGNNVVMYNIKNLPKDKNYKIELFYEEYKKGEKIREDIIAGIYSDEESPKIDSQVLTLNYQEDKIRFVFGEDGGYYSGLYEIKEKFEDSSKRHLTNEINLELGKEIYIYQASKGISLGNDSYSGNNIELGVPIDRKNLNQIVKKTEGEVFVKLVYKEAK